MTPRTRSCKPSRWKSWNNLSWSVERGAWRVKNNAPRSTRHAPRTWCPMIQVQHLTKRFPLPGGGQVVAVNNVSFTVAPGEVYGLLGPNGAGKTTTLRMILGLLTPSAGQAAIAGYASDQAPDEV